MNPFDFDLFDKNLMQMKKALMAVSKYAKSGLKNVSEDVLNKRKAICMGCEFWDKEGFGGIGKCNKCGCSIAKLWMATEECPIQKWSKEIDTK